MSTVPPKQITALRSSICLCAVSLALLLPVGCRGCSTSPQSSPPASPASTASGQSPATGGGAAPQQTLTTGGDNVAAVLPAKFVYIDSVPRGAQVYLTDEQPQSQDQLIGVTPLRLEPGKVSGKRVVVMMTIAELIRQMKSIPDLSAETRHLELEQEFGAMEDESPFNFFDTANSESTRTPDSRLVADGPIYQVDFPASNRVCAYFIPRGVSASKFYSLMPPDGSFPITKGAWVAEGVTRYHLSAEQALESAESLSRAGKYQTVVLSQTNPGYGERISMVVVGEPPDNERVEVTRSVGEVTQGVDY